MLGSWQTVVVTTYQIEKKKVIFLSKWMLKPIQNVVDYFGFFSLYFQSNSLQF